MVVAYQFLERLDSLSMPGVVTEDDGDAESLTMVVYHLGVAHDNREAVVTVEFSNVSLGRLLTASHQAGHQADG